MTFQKWSRTLDIGLIGIHISLVIMMRNFEFVCWDGLCSAGISWTLVVHVGKPWIHWTFNSNSSNFKVMTRPRCCCRKCKTRIEGKTNCNFFWTNCKTFFWTNCKTFPFPFSVQWSSTQPFDILEKKNVFHKGPTWIWQDPNIDTLLLFINFKRIWCYPDQIKVYQTSAL